MMRLALAILLLPAAARGQSFEAASVKATVRTPNFTWTGGPGTSDPGQITWTPITLWNLVQRAYGVELDQVNGPPWIRQEWYSVKAKIPPGTSMADFRLMLQHLLAERFHLAVHRETLEVPGYELTVAPGGAKLKRPSDTPAAVEGFPPLPPDVPSRSGISDGMVRSSHRETMAQFAADLGNLINQSDGFSAGAVAPRVTDKTGLTGVFEFRLEFAASSEIRAPVQMEPAGGRTIFGAIEKQLGLKLNKVQNVPVDVIMIDHADKIPTEN